jgi:hypothetical protein
MQQHDGAGSLGMSAALTAAAVSVVHPEWRKCCMIAMIRAQLGKRPISVYIISTTYDKLLSDVAAGLGDIASGNLTITGDRLEIVDFVALNVHCE